jgi:hypothetical protein
MKVGDIVKKIYKFHHRTGDGLGFVTAAKICVHRKYLVIFVIFPETGWTQWYHPSKLEVISEA